MAKQTYIQIGQYNLGNIFILIPFMVIILEIDMPSPHLETKCTIDAECIAKHPSKTRIWRLHLAYTLHCMLMPDTPTPMTRQAVMERIR